LSPTCSTTSAGSRSPADHAAVVALDEITVHAWDLAVTTGRDPAWTA
jgi:hypothetical protein